MTIQNIKNLINSFDENINSYSFRYGKMLVPPQRRGGSPTIKEAIFVHHINETYDALDLHIPKDNTLPWDYIFKYIIRHKDQC